MSKLKVRTSPDLSLTSQLHVEAKAMGDDHYTLWQRNVIDEFKSLPNEEIRTRLRETAFPYAVCLESWNSDFNISSCFRNANAFNAKAMYYVGNKKIDRRGMTGIHNYSYIEFLPTIDSLLKLKEEYTFIGVDNIEGAIPITDYQYKENSLLIFGSEAVGLTPEMQKLCDEMIYIPQFGSIRSLNAATASGIIMNDFVTKFNKSRK